MNDLDQVLVELGQFSYYQAFTFLLLFFPIIFNTAQTSSSIFTTSDITYRCLIPECEASDSRVYEQPWLEAAIPWGRGAPVDKCLRYSSRINSSSLVCSSKSFSTDTERCTQFVFKNNEKTITNEFGLFCEENDWKRTIVLTLNSAVMLIATPIAGILTDRFGRKKILFGLHLLTATIGTIRSVSNTYNLYLALEMLEAFVSAGVYSGFYIFGIEVVGPEKRGFAGAVICTFQAIGCMLAGLVAWASQDWRLFLAILYIPNFVFVIYFWILPESIRWLIANRKKETVKLTLERMSRWNKKVMTDEVIKLIENLWIDNKEFTDNKSPVDGAGKSQHPLKELMGSRRLVLRVFNCALCWGFHSFVFYGLSLFAVSTAGNKYLNFTAVSLAEVPGIVLSFFLANLWGRRMALCLGMAVSGAACLGFHFLQEGAWTLSLILYFCGKLAISESFATLYVLASEMFPTRLRHSIIGTCATAGRLGSILAPQMPLLKKYIDPVLVFAAISFLGVLFGLCFPETKDSSMPETIAEAEDLGKRKILNNNRNDETAINYENTP